MPPLICIMKYYGETEREGKVGFRGIQLKIAFDVFHFAQCTPHAKKFRKIDAPFFSIPNKDHFENPKTGHCVQLEHSPKKPGLGQQK